MRVSYTFELADQLAINRAALSGRGLKALHRIRFLGGFVGALVIAATILFLSGPPLQPLRDWPSVAVMTTEVSCLSLIVSALIVNKAMAKGGFSLNRLVNRVVMYEMSEHGVSSEHGTMRGMADWPRIRRCVTTSDYLLLFTSPEKAFAFPRRAFASDADFKAAIAFAKTRTPAATL